MRHENGADASQNGPHTLHQSLSNGSSSTPTKHSTLTNGSQNQHYTNGCSENGPTGPFFGHDREEVTRILIQSLSDLGYHNAAGTLSRESGFELEVPSVAAFRTAIQTGDWSEAEALLFGRRQESAPRIPNLSNPLWTKTSQSSSPDVYTAGLPLSDGANRHEMLFRMRQQKYLELLEQGQLEAALMVLRQELTPLHQDVLRLHTLSSLIMCHSPDHLRAQAHWDGAAGESRNHLLSELSKSISPSVMIPEHRLAVLLDQVQEQQVRQCLYHNTTDPPSLYHDHVCDSEDFPLHVYQELKEHQDEVWYLEFSNNGSMLASAGKDNKVIVYNTTNWRPLWHFQEGHDIGPNESGICYIAWSPDDRYLLSCSQAKEIVLYDTRNGHKIGSIDHFSYPVTTAAWAPDGLSFVVGSQDSMRPLGLYQLADQKQIHTWYSHDSTNMRINDCSISADASRLAAITSDNRVLVFDFQTRVKIADWYMEDKLTCVTLSHDGKTVLISMNEGRLLLLNSESGDVVQRYTGLKQSEFVIRSAFGGANENFVISGSEGKLYACMHALTPAGRQLSC